MDCEILPPSPTECLLLRCLSFLKALQYPWFHLQSKCELCLSPSLLTPCRCPHYHCATHRVYQQLNEIPAADWVSQTRCGAECKHTNQRGDDETGNECPLYRLHQPATAQHIDGDTPLTAPLNSLYHPDHCQRHQFQKRSRMSLPL